MCTAYALTDYILAANGRHPQLCADSIHTVRHQEEEDGLCVTYETRVSTFADGHTLTREQETDDLPDAAQCPACWVSYTLTPAANSRQRRTFTSLCQERFWLNLQSAHRCDSGMAE